MGTFVYLVIAGNIIDDYNTSDETNKIEIFDNIDSAQAFGSLFDYHEVFQKELYSSCTGMPSLF